MPVFDAVLGVTIVVVAFRVLTTPDLFEGVVLFIVFGLLMSLAWTRLDAVDVALAEAAIGAGVTGALFLNALGPSGERRPRPRGSGRFPVLLIPILVLGLSLALVVGAALLARPAGGGGVALVAGQIGASGTANPVTAVLLDFRGYDTLLEIVVLVVAVASVWALGPSPIAPPRGDPEPGPVLLAFVRLVIPSMCVVAGYLLWIGTSAPGGAFHAGAILGASGVLLVVAGLARAPTLRTSSQRVLIVLGVLGFLGVALGVMLAGRAFLEYPPGWAPRLILLIETCVAVSIAAILIALFTGGPPHAAAPEARDAAPDVVRGDVDDEGVTFPGGRSRRPAPWSRVGRHHTRSRTWRLPSGRLRRVWR